MTTTIIVILAIGAMAALIELSSRRLLQQKVAAGDAPVAEDILPFFERAEPVLPERDDRHDSSAKALTVGARTGSPSDEIVAREAAEVFVHWHIERHSIEHAHIEEIQSMIERLEKARQLVEQSGVGSAVCEVLRVMWSWPGWMAFRDWRPPMLIEQFTGGAAEETETEREIRWFRWKSGDERYRLSLALRAERAPDQTTLGDLRLWVGNALVLQLDVSRFATDAPENWSLTDVSALDPGGWMVEINEFAGRLSVADQRMRQGYEFSYFDEKARKIAIG